VKILNKKSTDSFLTKNVTTTAGSDLVDKSTVYQLPLEYSRILSAIRYMFDQKHRSEWTLVVLESQGIWSSWEDRNLILMMCESKKCIQPNEAGSGVLFESDEIADIISFVAVFCTFRYDFIVVDSNLNFYIYADHDDHIEVFLPGNADEHASELSKRLDKW
jgi:hypothetical protein